ncbi:major facilitator superfamily domain-containing protein [Cladorrhinum sp. PSN332]|nr:major facilitator superfamily domain-containing protein [Cladorrhinum sp. PSN332]
MDHQSTQWNQYVSALTAYYLAQYIISDSLQTGLRSGDSGSWVIGTAGHTVMGHVVASSKQQVYFVLMTTIFESVSEAMPSAEPRLPSPLTVLVAAQSIDFRRTRQPESVRRFMAQLLLPEFLSTFPDDLLARALQRLDLSGKYKEPFQHVTGEPNALIWLLGHYGIGIIRLLDLDRHQAKILVYEASMSDTILGAFFELAQAYDSEKARFSQAQTEFQPRDAGHPVVTEPGTALEPPNTYSRPPYYLHFWRLLKTLGNRVLRPILRYLSSCSTSLHIRLTIAVSLCMFLVSLDMTMIPIAILSITDDFRRLDQLSWYGAIFFLSNAASQSIWITFSRSSEPSHNLATFLASLLIFIAGNILCVLAPPTASAMFLVGRATGGFGAAGLVSTAAYIGPSIHHSTKAIRVYRRALGLSSPLGWAIGPYLGGVLVDQMTWRWCFWVSVIGCSLAGVLACSSLPKNIISTLFESTRAGILAAIKRTGHGVDTAGVLLMVSAIILYMFALRDAGFSLPWNSGTVIGLLSASGVAIWIFSAWVVFYPSRRKGSWPDLMILDIGLLRDRTVWAASLCGFLLAGSHYTLIYYVPIYLQSIRGDSPTTSGLTTIFLVLPTLVVAFFGTFFLNFLPKSRTAIERYPGLLIVSGAAVSVVLPILLSMRVIGEHSGWSAWVLALVSNGLGYSLSYIPSRLNRQFGLRRQLKPVINNIHIDSGPQVQLQYSAEQTVSQIYPDDLRNKLQLYEKRIRATILFFECLGCAVFIVAAQSALLNGMVQNPGFQSTSASGIPSESQVLTSGALYPDQAAEIIEGIKDGFGYVFWLSFGSAALGLIVGCISMLKFGPGISLFKSPPSGEGTDTHDETAAPMPLDYAYDHTSIGLRSRMDIT